MQSYVHEALAACKERIMRDLFHKPDDEWSSGYNAGINSSLALISSVAAKYEEAQTGCEFCQVFDFGCASAEASGQFASIHNAGGAYRYPPTQVVQLLSCVRQVAFQGGSQWRLSLLTNPGSHNT